MTDDAVARSFAPGTWGDGLDVDDPSGLPENLCMERLPPWACECRKTRRHGGDHVCHVCGEWDDRAARPDRPAQTASRARGRRRSR